MADELADRRRFTAGAVSAGVPMNATWEDAWSRLGDFFSTAGAAGMNPDQIRSMFEDMVSNFVARRRGRSQRILLQATKTGTGATVASRPVPIGPQSRRP
jgi:hypothetical protein